MVGTGVIRSLQDIDIRETISSGTFDLL